VRGGRPTRAGAAPLGTLQAGRAHPPSMGLPEPLKTRPSMSRDTGVFSTCAGHGSPMGRRRTARASAARPKPGPAAAGAAGAASPQAGAQCAARVTSPENSRVVPRLSMPDVPSNTCTTALFPSTSSTCPRRAVPSPSLMLTISAYIGFCAAQQPLVSRGASREGTKSAHQHKGAVHALTASTITRGPLTPPTVRYSAPTSNKSDPQHDRPLYRLLAGCLVRAPSRGSST